MHVCLYYYTRSLRVYACVFILLYSKPCVYACVFTLLYSKVCVCVYARVLICVYVYPRVLICVYVYARLLTYVCIFRWVGPNPDHDPMDAAPYEEAKHTVRIHVFDEHLTAPLYLRSLLTYILLLRIDRKKESILQRPTERKEDKLHILKHSVVGFLF